MSQPDPKLSCQLPGLFVPSATESSGCVEPLLNYLDEHRRGPLDHHFSHCKLADLRQLCQGVVSGMSTVPYFGYRSCAVCPAHPRPKPHGCSSELCNNRKLHLWTDSRAGPPSSLRSTRRRRHCLKRISSWMKSCKQDNIDSSRYDDEGRSVLWAVRHPHRDHPRSTPTRRK
jgi:hypothetical protein